MGIEASFLAQLQTRTKVNRSICRHRRSMAMPTRASAPIRFEIAGTGVVERSAFFGAEHAAIARQCDYPVAPAEAICVHGSARRVFAVLNLEPPDKTAKLRLPRGNVSCS